LEIAKQIHGITFSAEHGGYNFSWLPFHVCSIFIFAFPLATFLKRGSRVSNIFWAISLVTGVMLTLAFVFAPSLIMGPQIERVLTGNQDYAPLLWMNLHSIIFHLLAVLFVMLFIAFRPVNLGFKYLTIGGISIMLFVALAWGMANVFSRNFAMFYQWERNFLMQFVVYILHLVAVVLVITLIYYTQKIFNRKKNIENN